MAKDQWGKQMARISSVLAVYETYECSRKLLASRPWGGTGGTKHVGAESPNKTKEGEKAS
jgi:hypothetical protein